MEGLQAGLHALLSFLHSVVMGCFVVCKAGTEGGKATCQVLKFAFESPFFKIEKGASDSTLTFKV